MIYLLVLLFNSKMTHVVLSPKLKAAGASGGRVGRARRAGVGRALEAGASGGHRRRARRAGIGGGRVGRALEAGVGGGRWRRALEASAPPAPAMIQL